MNYSRATTKYSSTTQPIRFIYFTLIQTSQHQRSIIKSRTKRNNNDKNKVTQLIITTGS